MKARYLEVTFRRGKPIAAYLYLPRRPDDKSARTERRENGLIVDFSSDGRAIGIEITSPSNVSNSALSAVLREFGQEPVSSDELAPLIAA